ncbi:MAG: hypothetical protein CBD16_02625 [Betaproteobacteria bacterium TMED156]|nr:MAG: hypothetical protein CBD16_02625 [Betaproteobacteria bacterium TMED156]
MIFSYSLYFFKLLFKVILLTCFFFCFFTHKPILAQSKKWKEFHKAQKVTMFYSPKSLRGKGIKQLEVMLNFTSEQTSQDGKKIKSIRMIQNYDCTSNRLRLRSAINYSKSFLKGYEVSKGNEVTPWQAIPKGTPYSKLMKIICD